MVLLKSKWFWICSIFTFCATIFLGVVVHQANQPQAVIKVYKAVEFLPHRTPEVPADPLRSDSASPETDPPVDGEHRDFSEDTETDTTDTFTLDERPPADVDATTVSHLNTEVDAEVDAETVETAARMAEILNELSPLLQHRLDLLDRVEELAPSNGGPPELSPLRDKLDEEAFQLQRTIFELGNDYIMYSEGDLSPFQPGGEFYELLQLNHMSFRGVVE